MAGLRTARQWQNPIQLLSHQQLYAALSGEQQRLSPVHPEEEKTLREAEEVLRMLRDERFDPEVQ